jgi:hypothetical protein
MCLVARELPYRTAGEEGSMADGRECGFRHVLVCEVA